MQELTPSWREAFVRLAAEQRSSLPSPLVGQGAREPCGWSATIDGSMSSASAIVAALPGSWELDCYEEEELLDAAGEGIDLEWTAELWIAEDERAIFACVDHWQAGLIGTLTVFADEAAFSEMRATLRERDRSELARARA
jgi:hypothetical protein